MLQIWARCNLIFRIVEVMELGVDVWMEILSRADPHSVCRFSRTCSWSKRLVDANIKYLPRITLDLNIWKPRSGNCRVLECKKMEQEGQSVPVQGLSHQELTDVLSQAKYVTDYQFFLCVQYRESAAIDDATSFVKLFTVIELLDATSYTCDFVGATFRFFIKHISKDVLLNELRPLQKFLDFLSCNVFDERLLCDATDIFRTRLELVFTRISPMETWKVIALTKAFFEQTSTSAIFYIITRTVELPIGGIVGGILKIIREQGLMSLCTTKVEECGDSVFPGVNHLHFMSLRTGSSLYICPRGFKGAFCIKFIGSPNGMLCLGAPMI